MSRGPLGSVGGDRRAVSETLGYILVFAIIITTISTATVFGFNGLEDRQEAEQVTNVERAFDVLRDNFEDISRYEDPSRATEIRLAGGTLGFGDPVTITLGQWNSTNDSFEPVETPNATNVTFRPLLFQSDGGTVVYEGGVVFRGSESQFVARSPPPFVLAETTTVPVVATARRPGSEPGPTAVGGERTVLVVGDTNKLATSPQPLASRTVVGGDLRLRIDSPRASGWERQFRAAGVEINESLTSAGTVVAELDTDRARLPVTRISVRFE